VSDKPLVKMALPTELKKRGGGKNRGVMYLTTQKTGGSHDVGGKKKQNLRKTGGRPMNGARLCV